MRKMREREREALMRICLLLYQITPHLYREEKGEREREQQTCTHRKFLSVYHVLITIIFQHSVNVSSGYKEFR